MESIKDDAKKLFDDLKSKAKQNICSRCSGTGRLAYQGHVMNGVCFKCKGNGKVWNQAGIDAIDLRKYYRNFYQPAIGTDREADEARNLATVLAKLRLPIKQRR